MRALSATARDYFERLHHVGALNPSEPEVAAACVGEPISGDILQLHLQANPRGLIVAVRFKAYGCGWLIACGSLLAECMEGRMLAEIGHFRHHQLVKELDIPPEKLHCAVLAETALKAARRALVAKSTGPHFHNLLLNT
ncbi:MAG: iron-sulfur cluster assembly scaffold protein [Candidatus Competibacteraceae bacterium]|nr:iron-sulfur cluster assembly scaffold protein [Candidatus Competibacteraceae bacterium]